MTVDVDEICDQLQSPERRVKINCLEYIQHHCADPNEWSDSDVQVVYEECYLHLLKCYNDRYEGVRNHAMRTISAFIGRLPPNDFYLQSIVSALADRMGQQETLEESEEMRLEFMQQLHNLVRRVIETGSYGCMEESCSDIVRVLMKCMKDAYPAVQREACACTTALASSTKSYVFQQFALPLAKSMYGMLNHKHSQARIAAVNALGHLALHIDAKGDALTNLVMEVSPLLMDSMPLVRRECGEMGTRLLLELRDRYSFFERLIPLVLCCLKDESPEVRDYIHPLWVKCGKQYYDENEAELSKQEIADLPPPNYPTDVKRPTIGCRAIVQRSLRLIKLITRESSDWKDNVRLHSLKLLYQFVLHAEAAMTAKFFEIYADVARACRDGESIVVNEAFKVADLMGRLLKYQDWSEHGFEGLERNAKEGYLKCFYHMYTPALGMAMEDNLRFIGLLVEPEFSQTLKAGFQMYILKSVDIILEKTVNDVASKVGDTGICDKLKTLHKHAYIATIKVMALSLESEQSNADELQVKGHAILAKIAERCDCCKDGLHEKFMANALEYVENIDAQLDAFSEPILLFYGLIKLGGLREPYLPQLREKINTVFEHCQDEAKIKIFTALSIAMLEWSSTIRRPLDISCSLLQQFMSAVVVPHLVWKAGANAEAMRSLAIATVSSVTQGAAMEARQVLPAFAKYIPSLLEDQAVATRHYAVRSLRNFGPVPVDELKGIAYACLQRLDDPSAGIRILAASVIPRLEPHFEADATDSEKYKTATESWNIFIKHCFDLLYLHYDVPEERLKAAIKETVMELTTRYPEISKKSYKRTLESTNNSFSLTQLGEALSFIDDTYGEQSE